jgi:hypothetical protein
VVRAYLQTTCHLGTNLQENLTQESSYEPTAVIVDYKIDVERGTTLEFE